MIEIILIGSLATLAPAGLAAIWWYWRKPAWMGFADKTLWDWATILAIPTGVGLASLGISAVQIALERDAAQEAAVQAYFDRIGTLAPLLDESGPHVDRSLVIGRAQTAAVLRGADFEGARMNGAELHGADLRGADLSLAVGLRARQLANACLDATTLLPAGLLAVGNPEACLSGFADAQPDADKD